MNAVGKRIKEERNRLGWSQQRLADAISRKTGEAISREAISQWENGSSKTQKPTNLLAAADIFGVSATYLLYGGQRTDAAHTETQTPAEVRRGVHPAQQFSPQGDTPSEVAIAIAKRIDKLDVVGKVRILSTLMDIESPESRDQQSAELAAIINLFSPNGGDTPR